MPSSFCGNTRASLEPLSFCSPAHSGNNPQDYSGKTFSISDASTIQPMEGCMGKKRALADPSRLKPFDKDNKDLLRVVIETPKGSRNKFAFNPSQQVFELRKVLPAGMEFPYDFGFVPSTLAPDGDPTDVLVLMDEPAFPGCVLLSRIVGAIEGEQYDKKSRERNDRIIAVEKDAHSFASIKSIDDLGKEFANELEEFFTNYHRMWREEFKVLRLTGPKRARKLVRSTMV
jgi:inorganic pyrophosphatase